MALGILFCGIAGADPPRGANHLRSPKLGLQAHEHLVPSTQFPSFADQFERSTVLHFYPRPQQEGRKLHVSLFADARGKSPKEAFTFDDLVAQGYYSRDEAERYRASNEGLLPGQVMYVEATQDLSRSELEAEYGSEGLLARLRSDPWRWQINGEEGEQGATIRRMLMRIIAGQMTDKAGLGWVPASLASIPPDVAPRSKYPLQWELGRARSDHPAVTRVMMAAGSWAIYRQLKAMGGNLKDAWVFGRTRGSLRIKQWEKLGFKAITPNRPGPNGEVYLKAPLSKLLGLYPARTILPAVRSLDEAAPRIKDREWFDLMLKNNALQRRIFDLKIGNEMGRNGIRWFAAPRHYDARAQSMADQLADKSSRRGDPLPKSKLAAIRDLLAAYPRVNHYTGKLITGAEPTSTRGFVLSADLEPALAKGEQVFRQAIDRIYRIVGPFSVLAGFESENSRIFKLLESWVIPRVGHFDGDKAFFEIGTEEIRQIRSSKTMLDVPQVEIREGRGAREREFTWPFDL